ncbi:hypothetical protein LL14B4_06315 [Lactococcus lactis subsp. lactis]|uniref:Uncharacterized protein n=1 Tax=Lactococcus lactis subsp. lactis TaxID=1360 RepID=A0A2Z3KP91_LACLL|nr:hypothetical protein [Lactococcus lactis]AWN65809.1 hypothetical protein LL14B4_06315 [Lactococcus lactis subsp. lactis]
MEKTQNVDERIIEEVKNLIMFDNDLTYAERNALGIFYSKIEKGQTVQESIGPMMKSLNMLSSGSSQEKLSLNVKKLFDFALTYYKVPEKQKIRFYGSGGGLIHRFSAKEMLLLFLLVFVGLPLALYIKYLLR